MISMLMELSSSLDDSIFCIYFIAKYNKKHNTLNLLSILFIFIIFAVTLIGDYFSADFNVFFTVLLFLISLVYAMIISDKNFFNAICSTSIFKISLIVLSTSLYHIYSFIFNDFYGLLYGNDGYIRYIYVITHKILLFSVLKFILVVINSSNKYENKKNGLLTFLFSLITVLGLSITISVSEMSSSNLVSIRLFILALVFICLNIVLYILLFQISKLYKKNYDLALLKKISKYEEDRYNESISLWNSSEKIRHDLKNHMIAISGMLENNEIENSRQYINQYLNEIEIIEKRKFSRSGNNVFDYIIDAKLSPLKNTEIIIVGNIGDVSDISETDLASLIGNVLDNAIEAQEKVENKHIELLFNKHNDARMIICKNSIESSVLKNNKNLKTTKKTPNHGYGTKIISEIVQKYNGLVHYFEEGDFFGVQIMLPYPSSHKNKAKQT